MKTMFKLMYCDGVLTSEVVHYIVMVGISHREQIAAKKIAKLAASNNSLYFAKNDELGAQFMRQVRESLVPVNANSYDRYRNHMRVVRKNVLDMWQLLLKFPWRLLNSSAIEQRECPLSA